MCVDDFSVLKLKISAASVVPETIKSVVGVAVSCCFVTVTFNLLFTGSNDSASPVTQTFY